MKLALIASISTLTVLAVACGGGPKSAPAPANTPAPTEVAPTAAPTKLATAPTAAAPAPVATAARTPSTTSGEKSFSALFSSAFGGAFRSGGGNAGAGGLGQGDTSLLQYLPDTSDLPPGYTPGGQFTFRSPDGISAAGGMDIAAELAMRGDVTSPVSSMDILMAMVIKADDLQALGEVMKDLSQQDIEDALSAGGGAAGYKIKRVKVLDAAGLGDGGAGFEMTVDISQLGALIGGLAGSDAPRLDSMTMRMYFFGRGNYAGAVLRVAFSDTLPDDVDEVALANIIDGKLKSAP